MEPLPLGTDRSLNDVHERLHRVLLAELEYHSGFDGDDEHAEMVELALHLTDRALDHMGIQMHLDLR